MVAIIATLALLIAWPPAVVHGQTAPASASTITYIVKPGETLWSLAARFYGDGHQWRELARRNNLDVETAALQVGMTLTVPATPVIAGTKAARVAAAPADSTVPRQALARAGEGKISTPIPPPAARAVAPSSGTLAAQTRTKGDAVQPAAAPRDARTAVSNPDSAAGIGRPVPGTRAAAAVTASEPGASTAARADTGRLNFQSARGVPLGDTQTVATVRIGLIGPGDLATARKPTEVLTVFHRDIPDPAEAERRALEIMQPNVPVPRQAEYDAAPFVLSGEQNRQAGTVARRVGGSDEGLSGTFKPGAMNTDEVEVLLPVGATYSVGQRLVAFSESPTADRRETVAVPSGVLEVVSVEMGKSVIAVVREQSARIEAGQRVVPARGEPASRAQAERLSSPDVSTTVRWLDSGELMPTLQSYLVIGAGSAQGLRAGDELALYHRNAGAASDILTATARIVRVDGGSSTAIILRQYGHEIRPGMTARRFARAP